MTKLEASMKQLVNKAAAGDLRALSQMIDVTLTAEQSAAEEMPPKEVLDELDMKMMLKTLKRYDQSIKEAGENEKTIG